MRKLILIALAVISLQVNAQEKSNPVQTLFENE